MKQLVLHGSIILLLGLFCGAPMGSAIVKKKGDDVVRAWRVAHSSLVMGGIMLLAIAGVREHVSLSPAATMVMVWLLVISAYAFAVALPLGAYSGHRGLTAAPPRANQVVYAGNTIGAFGTLIAVVILVYGAFAAL